MVGHFRLKDFNNRSVPRDKLSRNELMLNFGLAALQHPQEGHCLLLPGPIALIRLRPRELK
jgi:hypothetical protein